MPWAPVIDGRLTGTFGDLSTLSFYPAHHITMGEGGWSPRTTCIWRASSSRFATGDATAGALPARTTSAPSGSVAARHPARGYDHKYIYSPCGYNLKATDSQAALGLTQLAKLPVFIEARRRNWQRLHDALADVPGLLLPSATPNSEPSWFGFVLTVLPDAPFTRRELVAFLEARSIGTRQVFAGNLTRHPAYQGTNYRVAGDLTNSDIITEHSFWIGVHPGLTDEMTDYMAQSVTDFVRSKGR